MLYICLLFIGGCLFLCSLCLLLFQVDMEIIYVNIMAYIGIILFGIGGLLTVIESVQKCLEANKEEDN